ncbi:MAG: histone deacetylase [Spirochaetales bacterium]|nr:histone deacetylase [Spirochaetales bacterium]
MVLFDVSTLLEFPRYGIGIPALDSRKSRTLSSLTEHPLLSPLKEQWLQSAYDDVFTLEDLLRAHSPEYAKGFFDHRAQERLVAGFELQNPDGTRNRWNPEEAELPLSQMVPPLLKAMAGTYKGAKIALESGFCHFLGGGTHHGHHDFAHGFCPINDVAVTLQKLRFESRIQRAWVIDVDAHKGDGTAAIFHKDDGVYTLSAHMASGWPLDGSLPPHHPSWIPSSIDIPIEAGEEHQYLERLHDALQIMAQSSHGADIAVVLAGADPWEHDGLSSSSRLKLTEEQLFARDQLISQFLDSQGLPSLWLMAGGYGEEAWKIHRNFLQWKLLKHVS